MEDDSNVLIDMEKKKVTLSMILKWYSVDFGKNNQEVLEFVVNYLTGVSNIELRISRIHGLEPEPCDPVYKWKASKYF